MRPAAQKKALLDLQHGKEVFLEERQYFVDTNQPSTSRKMRAMPEIFEQLVRRPSTKKVSKLKDFFKSFLALIHEKYVVSELTALIEDNTEYLHPKRTFNQIRRKWKTSQEM